MRWPSLATRAVCDREPACRSSHLIQPARAYPSSEPLLAERGVKGFEPYAAFPSVRPRNLFRLPSLTSLPSWRDSDAPTIEAVARGRPPVCQLERISKPSGYPSMTLPPR